MVKQLVNNYQTREGMESEARVKEITYMSSLSCLITNNLLLELFLIR